MIKKTLAEFKEFITKGNILDMAIGVVMGTAFGKIVTSVVNDLLMPLIGIMLGGLNFSALSITVRNSVITYGVLIQNIIDFLIVAVCLFFVIKMMAIFKRKKKKEEKAAEEAAPPQKSDEALLLEEIRDLLKEKK